MTCSQPVGRAPSVAYPSRSDIVLAIMPNIGAFVAAAIWRASVRGSLAAAAIWRASDTVRWSFATVRGASVSRALVVTFGSDYWGRSTSALLRNLMRCRRSCLD